MNADIDVEILRFVLTSPLFNLGCGIAFSQKRKCDICNIELGEKQGPTELNKHVKFRRVQLQTEGNVNKNVKFTIYIRTKAPQISDGSIQVVISPFEYEPMDC